MKQLIDDSLPAFSTVMAEMGLSDIGWEGLLGPATVEDHGDAAMPCHSLSRELKRSPGDIADEICSLISPLLGEVAIVSSINGFVNLKAVPSWLSSKASSLLSDPRIGVGEEGRLTIAVDLSLIHISEPTRPY